MAGCFEEIVAQPPTEDFDPSREGRLFRGYSMYRDEVWPEVQAKFPFVGWRGYDFYPAGSVSWRDADQSALFLVDPALNSPPFLEVIAHQTRTSLDRAVITTYERRAACRVGLPVLGDPYDAHVGYGVSNAPEKDFDISSVIEDSAVGALLGLAVGDALGTRLEFSKRDVEPRVTDMLGGGPFSLAPGEWTDDTSMALCLADSLIAKQELDVHDLLDRFVRWWQQGENSVNGRCFDIGNATYEALECYKNLRRPAGSGPYNKRHAGNGSLMRLAPVAIFAAPDCSKACLLAGQQSLTTHANHMAKGCCEFLSRLLVEAIAGLSKDDVLRSRFWLGLPELKGLAAGHWIDKSRDEISSSGYVLTTLEAALWCTYRTTSFEEALILAVNLGGDADTIGAVTGQLAGAIYGRSGIPDRWLANLAWRERIEERALALLRAGETARQREAK
jgi:ADP-ribosyl-[dinitrogen reductase] hydrolase